MNFRDTLLFQKMEKSNTIVFTDFDGTIFTPGLILLKEPFINAQTKKILTKNHIPLVFVTGRAHWSAKDDVQTLLFGLPKADTVIAGAGTIIYYRLANGRLTLDKQWETLMKESKLTLKDGKQEIWNREKIQDLLSAISYIPFTILPATTDKHLVRLYVRSLSIEKLHKLIALIDDLFSSGVKVVITEKLLQLNTLEVFSGNILILPEKAGKDSAVKYILNKVHQSVGVDLRVYPLEGKHIGLPLRVLVFGDASVDVPILTLKSVDKHYIVQSYGVNLTPLARQSLMEVKNENPQLTILDSTGPEAMLTVMQSESRNFSSEGSEETEGTEGTKEIVTHDDKNHSFTPAQNSLSRKFMQPLEPLLDNILDKNMSPNDISFFGLDLVKKSIDRLYGEKRPNTLQKVCALIQYFLGQFTDLLDGIRYRQRKRHCEYSEAPYHLVQGEAIPQRSTLTSNKIASPRLAGVRNDVNAFPGQLVDVYCDRSKEFYQLFKRATLRLRSAQSAQSHTHQEQSYQTFLAAISCILPSIARAQAEASGIVVKEKDPKGGSMFTRTRKLFYSLIVDALGFHNWSHKIDQEIYKANMATFQNRLSVIPSEAIAKSRNLFATNAINPQADEFNSNVDAKRSLHSLPLGRDDISFEKKAQERLLLLIQLLQEEDELIEKALKESPEILEKYQNEFKKNIEVYLNTDVSNLRKEWKIKDVRLHILEII